MNRLGIVKVGSDGQLKITQASKMKVQPHSSNLQLTHKANRSWIGDWGQGIRKEKPFSQCHQHISSSSILEALSSRRSDASSSRKFFFWHWEVVWNRLLKMSSAITTRLQQGSGQPFVAASGWNMSYAITIWLQQQSRQGFVTVNVSTWRALAFLKELIDLCRKSSISLKNSLIFCLELWEFLEFLKKFIEFCQKPYTSLWNY